LTSGEMGDLKVRVARRKDFQVLDIMPLPKEYNSPFNDQFVFVMQMYQAVIWKTLIWQEG
jgi:hypothetical protein